MNKPVILVLLGAYWPGNSASGPVQSFRAMADALQDRYQFRVIARDRPVGSRGPSIAADGNWHERGAALARYLSIGAVGAKKIQTVLRDTPHDLLWLNGFFDREFTIPVLLRRKIGLIPRCPVVVSPRGEFASGALGLKSAQKRYYLSFARRVGLVHDVTLHVTNEEEALNVRAILPKSRTFVAPNIRLLPAKPSPLVVEPSCLRVVFVGRVSRVKNLDYALRVLGNVTAPVRFDIYGPLADAAYVAECRSLADALPNNIRVMFHGKVDLAAVDAVWRTSDLLFLPTRGENFGHAIFEALSNGVPALISDTTPWRKLSERQAGWDLPLEAPEAFGQRIDDYWKMTPAKREKFSRGARAAAEQWYRESGAVGRHDALLRELVSPDKVTA